MPGDETSHNQLRPDRWAFAHSDLDQYGLTPDEFRIYFRVIRRWNEKDGCFEGARQMAKGCSMSDRTVRDCLFVLVGARLIRRVERGPGLTPRYDPIPIERWADPSSLPELRKQARQYRKSAVLSTAPAVLSTAVEAHIAQDEGAVLRTTGAVLSTTPRKREGTDSQPSVVRESAVQATAPVVRRTALSEQKIAKKVRYSVPQGVVEGTAGCGTEYLRGAVPSTNEVNPMKEIPLTKSPHTHSKAAPSRSRGRKKNSGEEISNGAGKNGSSSGSRFSLRQCREYAEHLRETRQGIVSPGGYATSIFRTGEADELIEEFITNPLPWAVHTEKELRRRLRHMEPTDQRRAVVASVLEELPRIRYYKDFQPLKERLLVVEIDLT